MMGRKPSKNPKNYLVKARLDYASNMKFEHCCERLNLTKAEFIRYLVDKVSKELYFMDWEKGVASYKLTDPELRKSKAERYLEKLGQRNLLPKDARPRKDMSDLSLSERWKLAKAMQ